MADEDFRKKIRELTEEVGVAMVTTMTAYGRHVSRPMAVQQTGNDNDLWFFTYSDSDKVKDVASHNSVNVALVGGKGGPWVSIAGHATVEYNKEKIDELWNPILKGWFPDGKNTPNLALLRVEAESAEYWESAASKVATVVSFVKAMATGKTAAKEIGENESGTL